MHIIILQQSFGTHDFCTAGEVGLTYWIRSILTGSAIILTERLGNRSHGRANTVCAERGGKDRNTQAEIDRRILDIREGTRADCIKREVYRRETTGTQE
jgi:hypothetical protein